MELAEVKTKKKHVVGVNYFLLSLTDINAAKGKFNADFYLDLHYYLSYDGKLKTNNIDWKKKSLSIRINSQESKLADLDIDHILKNTSDRLDLIMLPKVNNANDVLKIDKTISTLELKYKRKKKKALN